MGWLIIQEGKLKGLADRAGKVVVKPKYRELGQFSDGLAHFRLENKDRKKRFYGYLNTAGKEVIAGTFNNTQPFSDGKAAVFKGRWGYIDKAGKLIISHQFRQAAGFSGGYAVVNENEIIDATGKKIGKLGLEGKVIKGFSADRAVLQTQSGDLHIKPNGMPAYYAKFDEASDFVGDIALEKRGEKWTLTRKAGETETKVPFSRAAKNAYIAQFGERYRRKTPFGEIKDIKWTLTQDGIWRMIDQNGNLLSETFYDQVIGITSDNLLKVRKDGFFGVANLQGKFIAKPQNDIITSAGKNLFRVEYQGKIGYLKSNGEWIWEVE